MDSKFTRRPTSSPDRNQTIKFHRFRLRDNPFPNEPYVNRRSKDSRINGDIYEESLRQDEHAKLTASFLEPSRNEGSHLKLGYIEDASYLGRGNGKSAFILHATDRINVNYCLDVSAEQNKCFSVVLNPMAGGKAKSFDAFVDLLLGAILESKLIDIAIGSLILEVLSRQPHHEKAIGAIADESQLLDSIHNDDWYKANGIDRSWVYSEIGNCDFISELSPDTPLGHLSSQKTLFDEYVTGDTIEDFYFRTLRKGQKRFEFVFNDISLLFLAAGFNGGFVFVDDFERIPDFQSARQKRDFAIELRSVLFDGPYVSSAYGFYSFLLVLHAGVPRLINDAWQASGISSRSPMNETESPHVILFEKLESGKVESLLIRYLDEFRTDAAAKGSLEPFAEPAVRLIAETCEFNAGRILQTANSMLDHCAGENAQSIDIEFVKRHLGANDTENDEPTDLKASLMEALDLEQKAGED